MQRKRLPRELASETQVNSWTPTKSGSIQRLNNKSRKKREPPQLRLGRHRIQTETRQRQQRSPTSLKITKRGFQPRRWKTKIGKRSCALHHLQLRRRRAGGDLKVACQIPMFAGFFLENFHVVVNPFFTYCCPRWFPSCGTLACFQ